MAQKLNKSNMVKVEILQPFHIGIDKPKYYKPGDLVEVDNATAERWMAKGLAGSFQKKLNSKKLNDGKKDR